MAAVSPAYSDSRCADGPFSLIMVFSLPSQSKEMESHRSEKLARAVMSVVEETNYLRRTELLELVITGDQYGYAEL